MSLRRAIEALEKRLPNPKAKPPVPSVVEREERDRQLQLAVGTVLLRDRGELAEDAWLPGVSETTRRDVEPVWRQLASVARGEVGSSPVSGRSGVTAAESAPALPDTPAVAHVPDTGGEVS